MIFLGDHDIPLTGSNFGNLTAFRAIFSHIFTAHAQERPLMNFRLKFWSWYDHPLPRYSVIAADTLRDLVTLTFDLLTLVSGHTCRFTWSTPPPSLKILRISVLELWVLTSPIGYHWQCFCSHCACAVSRDLCVGANFSHIFEIPDSDLPIHYTIFMALRLRQMELCTKSLRPCVQIQIQINLLES